MTVPLGLKPQCIERLRQVIEAAIPHLEVQDGLYIKTDGLGHLSAADKALPQSGPIHECLARYVGDVPASMFVYQRLNRTVLMQLDLDGPRAPASQPLQDIPTLGDAAAVAANVVNELESLPWDYSIALAMPKGFSTVLRPRGAIPLTENLSITIPDATYEATFPLPKGETSWIFAGSPFASSPRDADDSYLQLQATGFITPGGMTATLEAVEDAVRQFAGLGIATRLFAPPRSYDRGFLPPHFVVHRKEGGRWIFDCAPAWSIDQSRAFVALEMDDVLGKLATDETRAGWVMHVLPQIARALSDDGSHRLRRGAQWFFDSCCEHDLPLAFLQAMVVMEVLLGGDKATADAVGLVELLASRLAYLIGRTQAEREEVAKQFREIYGVRSGIVHEGKSRLTFGELAQLAELRNLCRRVVATEIRLLRERAEPTSAQGTAP